VVGLRNVDPANRANRNRRHSGAECLWVACGEEGGGSDRDLSGSETFSIHYETVRKQITVEAAPTSAVTSPVENVIIGCKSCPSELSNPDLLLHEERHFLKQCICMACAWSGLVA